MSKVFTPQQVAILVLQKTETLAKAAMAGLTPTKLTPVPGVISPSNSNTASPTRVGAQAVVKTAKAKKPGQATDKPSKFYKSEQNQEFKKPSVQALHSFLSKQRAKK
jgi:hypothetical protein